MDNVDINAKEESTLLGARFEALQRIAMRLDHSAYCLHESLFARPEE
jgi:hypothetical protein